MELNKIFVDTSAWFALQITDDSHHQVAKKILERLLPICQDLITSNHVIGETYTLLRTCCGYKEARRFIDILRQSPRISSYFVGQKTEKRAFEILDQFQEHPFSFVDAISFATMEQLNIKYAFSFDKHFIVAGFPRIGIDVALP